MTATDARIADLHTRLETLHVDETVTPDEVLWLLDELTATRNRERALREALEDIARDGEQVGITAVVITAKRILLEATATLDNTASE